MNIGCTKTKVFAQKQYEPCIYKILGPAKTGKTILAQTILSTLQLDKTQGFVFGNENQRQDYPGFVWFDGDDENETEQADLRYKTLCGNGSKKEEEEEKLSPPPPPNFVVFDFWIWPLASNKFDFESLFMWYRKTNTSIVIVSRDLDERCEQQNSFAFVDYTMICSNHEETSLEPLKPWLPRIQDEKEIQRLLYSCTYRPFSALKINHRLPLSYKYECLLFANDVE